MTFSKLAVAALVASMATAASAVTVVGATTIRIENALDTYIQVAEVQAVDFGNTNVALAGTASASSVWQAGISEPGEAIDGNTGGNYFDASQRIFHSASGAGQFLQISIAPTTLASLTIWGRSDCCRSRDFFDVSIFNATGALLWSGQYDVRDGAQFRTVNFIRPVGGGVPEPLTWALMVTGFGLVGTAARRRAAATA
jgi:hypothetical protein